MHALVEVDLAVAQADQLRDAQARGVQHLEHRAVAIAQRIADDRRGQQRFDFLLGQRLRQRAADLRHRDLRGRILAERRLRAPDSGRSGGRLDSCRAVERGRAPACTRAGDEIQQVGARRAHHLDMRVQRASATAPSDRRGMQPSVFGDSPRSIHTASRNRDTAGSAESVLAVTAIAAPGFDKIPSRLRPVRATRRTRRTGLEVQISTFRCRRRSMVTPQQELRDCLHIWPQALT